MSRTQRQRPRSKRQAYGMTTDHRGVWIERDTLDHEQLLAVHGESKSGLAYAVSLSGDWSDVRWVPKALCDLGEPCGGFQRVDANMQRQLVTIYSVSAPGFIFDEKGLR